MLFPFASWESPSWRSELLKHARAQTSDYALQLARVPQEESWLGNQVAVNSNWLFFRPLEDHEDAGFVVTHPCSAPFIEDDLEVASFNDDDPNLLRASFNTAFQQSHFARIFFLNEHEELRQLDAIAHYAVLVGASGWAQWIKLNNKRTHVKWFAQTAGFLWTDSPDPARFLMTPALQQWKQIAQQKADASSDCAFARRALDWPEEEMLSLLRHWSKGSYAELEAVLRAAILCQSNLWTGVTGYEWAIELNKLHIPWHRGSWARFDELQGVNRRAHVSRVAPDEMRDILRRVAPYFEIDFNEELTTRHLEAARWAYRFNESMIIQLEAPTAHEQLEAAFFWSEWQAAHPPIN